jgi:hypothetical protein
MILRRPLVSLALLCLTPTFALGQSDAVPKPMEGQKASVLTVLTEPFNVQMTLSGTSKLTGPTPLDIPPNMVGVHKVLIPGQAGIARTQGSIYLPAPGALPFVVSEEPGISPVLILRGLNFPGIPDLMGGQIGRGLGFTTAAVGAGVMAVRAHVFYRQRLDEVGGFAADRAQDERYQRNAWLTYGAAVWGMSALEYWIRPRFSLIETTTSRLTLGVPKVTRVGAMSRSLFLPGAGQEYANHRTRGIVWLSAVLGAGAGYVVADYKVQRDETDLKWAQINLDDAGPSTVAQAQAELGQAERSLNASKDIRTAFLIGIVGFYALNVADATVMYLTLQAPEKPRVSSISPIMLPDGPGLGVSMKF